MLLSVLELMHKNFRKTTVFGSKSTAIHLRRPVLTLQLDSWILGIFEDVGVKF